METKFWLIGYGNLVYDRAINAFVPGNILHAEITRETLNRLTFDHEEDADTLVQELVSLGCKDATKKGYRLEVPD